MNGDVIAAKKILDTNYTCVMCYKGAVLTSNKAYNEAVLDFYNSKFDFSMFSLAVTKIDKEISKIIIDMKIKNVFSYDISSTALNFLKDNEITPYYNNVFEE
ncbi:MAG: DUF1893 domain-containing protein [Acholeplasmatales bacterium]|nr:DUF1893 domain-containing protein [Acholeplasmatales bacterium]